MDVEEGVKLGEHPNLGPVNITVGSRVVPLKRRPPDDTLLLEIQTIRVTLVELHKHLTRPNWLVRLFRRILSWVA